MTKKKKQYIKMVVELEKKETFNPTYKKTRKDILDNQDALARLESAREDNNSRAIKLILKFNLAENYRSLSEVEKKPSEITRLQTEFFQYYREVADKLQNKTIVESLKNEEIKLTLGTLIKPYSLFRLYSCYTNGTGVAINKPLGLKCLEEAANHKHLEASLTLGELYIDNNEYNKAITCYSNIIEEKTTTQIEEHCIDTAKYYLGLCYRHNASIEKNNIKAHSLYKESREHYISYLKSKNKQKGPSSWAYYYVGRFYFKGLGIDKNEKIAEHFFKKSADLGHVKAQSIYAKFHINTDIKVAIQYYALAAKQNDPHSQHALALLYLQTRQNYSHVEQLLLNAAEEEPEANSHLADLYYEGYGPDSSGFIIEKNEQKAFTYTHIAAQQEDPQCQYQLAEMYFKGIGVESDDKFGAFWLAKAADNGSIGAQQLLQTCYEKNGNLSKSIFWRKTLYNNSRLTLDEKKILPYEIGKLCLREEKNKEAAQWFLQGAQFGKADSQYEIGCCYLNGIGGVEINYSHALYWLNQSAAQQYHPAFDALISYKQIYENILLKSDQLINLTTLNTVPKYVIIFDDKDRPIAAMPSNELKKLNIKFDNDYSLSTARKFGVNGIKYVSNILYVKNLSLFTKRYRQAFCKSKEKINFEFDGKTSALSVYHYSTTIKKRG